MWLTTRLALDPTDDQGNVPSEVGAAISGAGMVLAGIGLFAGAVIWLVGGSRVAVLDSPVWIVLLSVPGGALSFWAAALQVGSWLDQGRSRFVSRLTLEHPWRVITVSGLAWVAVFSAITWAIVAAA